MASGALPAAGPTGKGSAPVAANSGDAELVVHRQLNRTKLMVKWVDLGILFTWAAAGLVLFFLVLAIFDHWVMSLGSVGRWLSLVGMLVGLAWLFAKGMAPLLLRSINPAYAAFTIEETSPSMKNSISTYLDLERDPQHVHAGIYDAVGQKAARDIAGVKVDAVVDRSQLIRVGYLLVALFATFAAYKILSPRDPIQTMARVLMPWADIARPSRVRILEVVPGHKQVYFGDTVEVKVSLRGTYKEDRVYLVYSTADGQTVDRRVELKGAESLLSYSGMLLPPEEGNTGSPGAASGLLQDLTYRIEAGDAISNDYRLSVITAPTILVKRVEYEYPAYMKKAGVSVENQGDLFGPEGTRVSIEAVANVPMQSAVLELDVVDGKPAATVAMVCEGTAARGALTLALGDDGSAKHKTYQIRLTTSSNERNAKPILHTIEVTPDMPPEVSILSPETLRHEVPLDGNLPVEVRAVDPDFGLSQVWLSGKLQGTDQVIATLHATDAPAVPQFTGKAAIFPAKLGLKVGDELTFMAMANDNRHDTTTGNLRPSTAQSTKHVLRVLPPRGLPMDADKPEKEEGGDADPMNDPAAEEGAEGSNKAAGESSAAGEEGTSSETEVPPEGKSAEGAENTSPMESGADSTEKSAGKKESKGGKESEKSEGSSSKAKGSEKESGSKEAEGKEESGEGSKEGKNAKESSGGKQAGKEGKDSKGGEGSKGSSKEAGGKEKKSGSKEKSAEGGEGKESAGGKDKSKEKGGASGGKGNEEKGGGEKSNDKSGAGTESGGTPMSSEPQAGGDSKAGNQGSGDSTGESAGNTDAPTSNPGNPDQPASGAVEGANSGGSQGSSGTKPTGDHDGDKFDKILEHMEKSRDAAKKEGKEGKESGTPSEGGTPNENSKVERSEDQSTEGKNLKEFQGTPPAGGEGGKKSKDQTMPSSATQKNTGNSKGGTKSSQAGAGETSAKEAPIGGTNTEGKSKEEIAATKQNNAENKSSATGNDPSNAGKGINKERKVKGESTEKLEREVKSQDGSSEGGDGDPASTGEKTKEEKQENDPGDKGGTSKGLGQSSPGAGSQGNDKNGGSPTKASQDTIKKEKGGPKSKDGELSTPSHSKKQNDVKGGQAGDMSGGGKQGGGQRTDKAGKGVEGRNASAETGGGKSSELGKGPDGDMGGDGKEAEGATGTASEKLGNGSTSQKGGKQKGPGQQDDGAGDTASGESPMGAGEEGATGEEEGPGSAGSSTGEAAGKSGKAGKSPDGQEPMGSDSAGGSSVGEKEKGPMAAPMQSDASGTGGAVGGGGGTGMGEPSDATASPLPGGEVPDGEKAKLEYSRKATSMALDYLREQEHNPDPELLKELKWTEADLKAFMQRWDALEKDSVQDEAKRQELDETLRSLGLSPPQSKKRVGGKASDDQRGLGEGQLRLDPPSRYRDQFDAFRRRQTK